MKLYNIDMIKDMDKKCRMFSSLNRTNISVIGAKSKFRNDYYGFDIPKFIEKKIQVGIEHLLKKHGPLLDHQVILYEDRLKLCWLVYILEDEDNGNLIIRLGPFLRDTILSNQIKYFGNLMKLSVENIRILENMYGKVPIYEESEIRNVFTVLTNLLRNDLDEIELIVESVSSEKPSDNKYSGRFTQYDFASSNYEAENFIMKLIETGDLEKLNKFIDERMSSFKLPTRHRNDPLRNAKNFAITANSISARAALRGGLNPNLVHSISTKFALLIEQQISVSGLTKLNQEIVFEYCNSVRDFSLSMYSKLIKKAILYIRRHLSIQISLEDIAKELHVNRAYLSRLFKKETGKNITDFIHGTKVNESLDLVKSNSYDIIEIANIFGYCNAAYFSYKFKQIVGIAPKQYSKSDS